MPIHEVQRLLGHESLETTGIYLRMRPKTDTEAVLPRMEG